jgi:hypothetical protein
MCIGNNFYAQPRVEFNDTILLALEVRDGNGPVEHVLGYYNKVRTQPAAPAQSRNLGWDIRQDDGGGDFGWHIAKPAAQARNAMLFAVPAREATLGPDSLIPVSGFPHFMEDYKRAVAPRPPQTRGFLSFSAKGLGDDDAPVVVKGFDNGVYDVIIARNAESIPGSIAAVDDDKRPQVNHQLYKNLGILYPRFTFVLFCFSEKDAEQAGCVLMKYEPIPEFDHLLYLPGLDGHNGTIENRPVKLNHTLVVGSYKAGMATQQPVDFTDPALQDDRPYYLLPGVIGKVIPAGTLAPQGDFLCKLDDVRKGKLRVKRHLPPGWSKLHGSALAAPEPYFIER